jgi:hypothetical protein
VQVFKEVIKLRFALCCAFHGFSNECPD